MDYKPDMPTDKYDQMITECSGPEPEFDSIARENLLNSHADLTMRVQGGGLLQFASLGLIVPWLYRLTFSTRGYTRSKDGEIQTVERHVFALRFLPDYLRRANRFEMLKLVEPSFEAFHPNISPTGAVCVEIYPREPLVEICHSLHDLIRWRLKQYDERDALNPIACTWGRENVTQPIDNRPLFGPSVSISWQPSEMGSQP